LLQLTATKATKANVKNNFFIFLFLLLYLNIRNLFVNPKLLRKFFQKYLVYMDKILLVLLL
jgi:hypothetical protein